MALSDDIASDLAEVETTDEAFVSVTHTTTDLIPVVTAGVLVAPLNMSSDTLFESKKDYENKVISFFSLKSTITMQERETITYSGIIFMIITITSEDQYTQTFDAVYKSTIKAHTGA